MIPLDKLKSLKQAIVHANCPDGKAAGVILKDALPDLEIHFVKYDTEEHKQLEPSPNTIFCDFSPWLPKLTEDSDEADREIRAALIKQWNEAGVVVLDHHSRDIVEPYTFHSLINRLSFRRSRSLSRTPTTWFFFSGWPCSMRFLLITRVNFWVKPLLSIPREPAARSNRARVSSSWTSVGRAAARPWRARPARTRRHRVS